MRTRLNESDLHDAASAPQDEVLVEAYGDHPFGSCCAASLNSFDLDLLLLPYNHSICKHRQFCSPYEAKLNAIKLGQQLLTERFGQWSLPQEKRTCGKYCKSGIRNHHSKEVRFCSNVEVFIGCEASLNMNARNINSDVLQTWCDKPWALRPLSETHFGFGAPLSSVAASSSPNYEPISDAHDAEVEHCSFMQRSLQQITVKNSPYDEHQEQLIQAFNDGHADPQANANGLDDESDSQAVPDEIQTGTSPSSDNGPPSSDAGRQLVVLYHLDEPPILAMVTWNSYEAMMTEIAHDFARHRDDLVDAYEIGSPPLDTQPDATPVIVYILGDIPIGHVARLILCDWDFHAPQHDPNYRRGPEVRRSVIPVPLAMTRDAFLHIAKVHRHCHLEGDTCFVWFNHVTWLDTDTRPKQVAHGDYLQIALPPSNGFQCATSELVGLRQRGWTDQEIVDILFDDDAMSRHSPSLLGEDDVRALARRQEEEPHDEQVAFQTSLATVALPSGTVHQVSRKPQLPADTHVALNPTSCSLTDEFLQAVRLANSLPTDPAPDVATPVSVEVVPAWMQLLQEQRDAVATQTHDDPQARMRAETWFLNPRQFPVCRHPRIALLSNNPQYWERELLAPWFAQADLALPTQFAIVLPTPVDGDRTAVIQIVIEQQSEPFSRAAVITVYDTDDIDSGPQSHARVISDRVTPHTIFNLVGIADQCPPEQPANECLLWVGNTAIQPDQFVNVRNGMAFRLCIKRGIRTTISELLSLSDEQIRVQLQSAIWGQIFRRPHVEGFPADVFSDEAVLPPHLPTRNTHRNIDPSQVDAWRSSLQSAFDDSAAVEQREEGPVIYVLVWYVNAITQLRCLHPRVARLDNESSWWRQSIIDLWTPELVRGVSVQVHHVSPPPPREPWRFHAAHILLSQALAFDQVAVIITDIGHVLMVPFKVKQLMLCRTSQGQTFCRDVVLMPLCPPLVKCR